jgi:hypothetical protein
MPPFPRPVILKSAAVLSSAKEASPQEGGATERIVNQAILGEILRIAQDDFLEICHNPFIFHPIHFIHLLPTLIISALTFACVDFWRLRLYND